MCSFLFTSKKISDNDIELSNQLLKYRGPDDTKVVQTNYGTFIHNRLKIRDDVSQPVSYDFLEIMFNGEIYNNTNDSEIDFIKESYITHGNNYATFLDGEFSILIYDKRYNKLVISVDTFKTKPLWYSVEGTIGISTYKSSLHSLGYKNIIPMPANTTLVIDMETKNMLNISVTTFNLDQFKNMFDDWIEAFEASIKKRSNTDKKIFIGLSSGYDSGCIASSLLKNNVDFNAYTVSIKENMDILNNRKQFIKNYFDVPFSINSEYMQKALMHRQCELSHDSEYNYICDRSSAPLMKLGYLARNHGCKVFLSGTGCDEIIGDYYIPGVFCDVNSCFFGKYPENLQDYFPWKNFFNGTMRKYLTKDEYIIGSLGIEARYPFLDKQLVQEFLNLTSNLKNLHYKSPLREYLLLTNFPFKEGEKRGFSV